MAVVLLWVLINYLDACRPTPGPGNVDAGEDAATVEVGSIVTASDVYAELVTVGCIEADDSGAGLQAVIDLENQVDRPSWIDCLFNGTPIAVCGCGLGDD